MTGHAVPQRQARTTRSGIIAEMTKVVDCLGVGGRLGKGRLARSQETQQKLRPRKLTAIVRLRTNGSWGRVLNSAHMEDLCDSRE